MDRERKAAIVTGAGHGIGEAVARRLARDGAAVVVADIDGARAEGVAGELAANGAEAVAVTVDVSRRDSVDAMVEAALRAFGRLDIQVSNAGIMDRAPFLDMSETFWRHVLDTNLSGAFFCGQAAARAMIKGGHLGESGGRIVNIASNSGIFGGRGRAAYGASKAGIINLTQTMAIELAEHGILVNAVAPGPTYTGPPMPDEPWPSAKARMPIKRFGRPEEIAALVAFVASEECSFTTGHVYGADGGLTISGIMEG